MQGDPAQVYGQFMTKPGNVADASLWAISSTIWPDGDGLLRPSGWVARRSFAMSCGAEL